MSHSVFLKDGTSYELEDDDAFDLSNRWELAVMNRKPFVIELGGNRMLSSEIRRISKNHSMPMVIPDLGAAPEIDKNKCRGQYSIQKQIHEVIRHDYPKTWMSLVRDQTIRENIRQTLLASSDEWCDYKAGKCACEDDYQPNQPVQFRFA